MIASRAIPGLVVALGLASGAWAAEQAGGFVAVTPSELKWIDQPEIGHGAKMAVIEGNPKAAAPFTFQAKLPPHTKVPEHTHPLVEHVTVLSGTFYFATGDKFDEKKAKAYPPGSTLVIPKGTPMYAFTKDKAAVIQVHGVGPWGMDFLKPQPVAEKK